MSRFLYGIGRFLSLCVIALQFIRIDGHLGSLSNNDLRKLLASSRSEYNFLGTLECIVTENRKYFLTSSIFRNLEENEAQSLMSKLKTFPECDTGYRNNIFHPRTVLSSCNRLFSNIEKRNQNVKTLCVGHNGRIFKFDMTIKHDHGSMRQTTNILQGEQLTTNPSVKWEKVIAKRVSKCDNEFEVYQEKEIYDKLKGTPNTFNQIDFFSSYSTTGNCVSSFIFKAIPNAQDGFDFWIEKPIIENFADGFELLLKMLYQISGVLQTMDQNGLFHSDVKLENILVEVNYENILETEFYLFDFGGSWNKKWKLGSFQLLMTPETVSPEGIKLTEELNPNDRYKNEKKTEKILKKYETQTGFGQSGCLDMYSLKVEFLSALWYLCKYSNSGKNHPFFTFCSLARSFDEIKLKYQRDYNIDHVFKRRNEAFDDFGEYVTNYHEKDSKVTKFYIWLRNSIKRPSILCLNWKTHRKNLDDIRSHIRQLRQNVERLEF